MDYSQFLAMLNGYAEPSFADFQRKLISTNQQIIGVRTSTLRKISRTYQSKLNEVLAYPNEIYEVVFIKLTMISSLSFERFKKYLDYAVSIMDNWATCDSFKGKYIRQNKQAFLSTIDRIFRHGGEFYERYALVALLTNYVESEYLPLLRSYLVVANTD